MRNKGIGFLVMGIVFSLLFAVNGVSGPLPKPVSNNTEAQNLIDRAWELENIDSNAEIYKKCISLLEEANKLDPNNYMILTDLSRYYWCYGDNLPKQTKEQQKQLEGIYKTGLGYAEKSLAVKETPPGHYWWAVNKAASLEFSSIFAQAGGFPGIKKHSDYVVKHEPDYDYGAPGRLWTEIIVRVPKIVVQMVGWNVQEVIDLINDAIKKEPGYLDNYVYKARFYWTYFGDKEEALKLLDYALKQEPNILPNKLTANRVSQRDARELWNKITGKEYPEQ